MKDVTISLDAMSGDQGPSIAVPAALNILKIYPSLRLILVGDQAVLAEKLNEYNVKPSKRLIIQHASQIITMTDPPAQALRYKKDSSMRVAINLVKQNKAQACVSAGNTGALMGTARFVLKTLPGVDRPAIITQLPARNKLKRVRILDLGANVDSSAEQLFQFAVMGSVLTAAVDGIEAPRVALLNIGEEEIKGNEQVKKTAALLSKNKDINYIGYIEGDGIFKGEVDVIVCDGFVGNVALKTTEGLAKFIGSLIKEEFGRNFLTKFAGAIAWIVIKRFIKRMDPALYNGASLVGLRGIVIKSHGDTTIKGFEKAIERAVLEVDNNVPELIKNKVDELLNGN